MNPRTHPDFVMVGASVDDGVMLLASTKMTYVQLEAEVDEIRSWPDRLVRADVRYTLSTEMREYVTVVAPTYGEAFETLFKTWSPERGEKLGISAGQSAVKAAETTPALPSGA